MAFVHKLVPPYTEHKKQEYVGIVAKRTHHIISLTDCQQHLADDDDIRLLMSEHPCVLGVNGDSSAHVEGAEHSTQVSLIVLVLQNWVSAWKMIVDSYVVVRSSAVSVRGPWVIDHRTGQTPEHTRREEKQVCLLLMPP